MIRATLRGVKIDLGETEVNNETAKGDVKAIAMPTKSFLLFLTWSFSPWQG